MQQQQRVLRAIVAPSILSCDFARLADECQRIQAQGADWLHIDVMDYRFVPNLTLGPPIIKALRNHDKKGFFDCHAMIQEPYRWVDDFAKAGASQLTFHYEADVGESHETLARQIKAAGMLVGLSLKPNTQLDDKIYQLLDTAGLIDLVLVMTVEPGFGGQKFMQDMMQKVKTLRQRYPLLDIQVDGGITVENVQIAAEAGANVIVSGTGIFSHRDPQFAITQMKSTVQKVLESANE